MKTMNIRLGIGLEDVLFGQSVEDVERSFGPAPESSFERDEDDSIRILAYPSEGIHLTFHKEDDFRLGAIEVSLAAGVYLLFGTPLRAVGKEDVIDILGRNLSPVEMEGIKEDVLEAIGQSALSVSALSVTFYFGRDRILEDLEGGGQ